MLKDGKIIADGDPNKVINRENLNKLYGIKVEVTKNYVGPDTPSWRNDTNYSSVSSASHGLGTTGGKDSEAYKEERRAVSSKYTIAPAYNKGAYQVIGEDSTKDIGR